jgi:hypothetical protein
MLHIADSDLPEDIPLTELRRHLTRMKPIMHDIQTTDISRDLNKELAKIAFIREPPPPRKVRRLTPEHRDYESAYREFKQGRRKTPPKYSLSTHRLVPDESGMSDPFSSKSANTEEDDYELSRSMTSRDLLSDKGKRRRRRRHSVYRKRC